MSKTILITGAGSGFGEGAAFGMARNGHNVIATVQVAPQVTPLREKAAQMGLKNLRVERLDLTDRIALTKAQLDQVYPALFVPINLNTASSADIMLIPGMTRRMVHEFEEYRPYTSFAQFDKEIGKYVPKAEVDRLRSYTTLN